MSGPRGRLIDLHGVPDWLAGLARAAVGLDAPALRALMAAPPPDARPAAVLVLFGEDGAGPGTGPDLLMLRRADTLGEHAGQVAFPGGGVDPDDTGPVDTALREAVEEVGVRPDGVRPVAVLSPLYVPVSGFGVTPVLAYWHRPGPVRAVDPAETAAVARVPLASLADPANRLQVRHPSGLVSPAYLLPNMLVWGFTAGVVSAVLTLGGWERPWDTERVRDLDVAWRLAAARGTPTGDGDGSSGPDHPDGTLPPAGAEV